MTQNTEFGYGEGKMAAMNATKHSVMLSMASLQLGMGLYRSFHVRLLITLLNNESIIC